MCSKNVHYAAEEEGESEQWLAPHSLYPSCQPYIIYLFKTNFPTFLTLIILSEFS